MGQLLPGSCRRLLSVQHGVIARWQVAGAGLSMNGLRARLNTGKWQPLQRGVYASFTGEPPRIAVLWAAALRAGPAAILSHESAAELDGLLDTPATPILALAAGRFLPAPVSSNDLAVQDQVRRALGGQQHPQPYTDTGSVLSPELWNPVTGKFTVMAPEVSRWSACRQ